MANEQMILSGAQIASYSNASATWSPPTWTTHLEFQNIAPLGNADSRYILTRTQGDGDLVNNGQLFTIHVAVDDGAGNLVPGALVMDTNFVTPDAYGGLGAGDDYLGFGIFGGARFLIKLDGFDGSGSFVVTPGDDVAPGGDGEISISDITNARPTDAPLCFAEGTMILTNAGPRAVQDLVAGDLVQTLDNGLQPLRWIGSQHLSALALAKAPQLAPIRIAAGSLGALQPQTDLTVSPQHRILLRSKLAQRMFGAAEVLVAAKHLVGIEGVSQRQPLDGVTYYHILFDRHEIVFSNGAATESLFTGPEALKSLHPAARSELAALFPELLSGTTCAHVRDVVPGRRSRQLVIRHSRNHIDLIETAPAGS